MFPHGEDDLDMDPFFPRHLMVLKDRARDAASGKAGSPKESGDDGMRGGMCMEVLMWASPICGWLMTGKISSKYGLPPF